MKKPNLSKSKVKNNSECVLRFFNEVHYPKLQKYDKQTLNSFDIGKLVDLEAKSKFPQGIDIKSWANIDRAKETLNHINKGAEVIFEASFIGDDTAVRCDILKRNDDDTFDMIEVKSSSKIKPDYFDDVFIQYYVIKASQTIKIRNVYIWYVNTKTEDPDEIFTKVDFTNDVLANEERYKKLMESANKTLGLNKENPPVVELSTKCHTCPFKHHCWENILKDPKHVLNLPSFDNRWDAYKAKVTSIDDPKFKEDYKDYLNKYPHRIKAIEENRGSFLKDKVKPIINSWKYPLNFLDFETVNPAVPIFPKTKPYENRVVQYSLDILDENKNVTHHEFLHDSFEDPEKAFVLSLINNLNNEGSIVVYDSQLEIIQLRILIKKETDPNIKAALLKIVSRIVDLQNVIENHVYHPDFMGHFGLKTTAPILLKNNGYEGMEINDGRMVGSAFYEMVETEDMIRKEFLRDSLIEYCSTDTLYNLEIYLWAKNLCD